MGQNLLSTVLVPYVGEMNIPATPAKNQGQGFDQIRDDVPDVGYCEKDLTENIHIWNVPEMMDGTMWGPRLR